MIVEFKGKLYDSNQYTNKAGQYGASARIVKDNEPKTLQIATRDESLGSKLVAYEMKEVVCKVEMGTGNFGTEVSLLELNQIGSKQ